MPNQTYILINSYDQVSRDYMIENPAAPGVIVVDWNVDQDAVAAYLAAGGAHPSSFPMTYTITTPAVPNLPGFFQAINADTTLNDAEKGVLAGYFGTMAVMLQGGMGMAIPGVWNQIIAAYGPSGKFDTWLTTDIQALVVGYASANNLTLVIS